MARIWREGAGHLLLMFAVLDGLLFLYTHTAGAGLNAGQYASTQMFWLALDGFLIWRIWRGGNTAWGLLMVVTTCTLAMLVMGSIRPWALYQLGLITITAGQAVLLVSPAVRSHVRRSPDSRLRNMAPLR